MPRLVPVLAAACSLALAACQPPARASDPQAAPAPARETPSPSSSPAPSPSPSPSPSPADAATKPWPSHLVLGIGERVALPDGTLALQRIAADSRCPKDAQCIWAGEVTLAFVFTSPGGPARPFQLSQRTTPKESLGSHDVELTDFGPCPAGHAPASPTGCASVAFRPSEMR